MRESYGAAAVVVRRSDSPERDRPIALPWAPANSLSIALAIALLWRVLVAVAGIAGEMVLPRGKFTSFSLIRSEHWARNPLTIAVDAAVRGDGQWYAGIARHGYFFSSHRQSSIAFYPLYPVLVKLVSVPIGNVYIAGVLLSTVCLLAAVVALHAWMAQRGLARSAPLAVLFLLCFPWSVFYAAMYSESLFLLLAVAVFLSWERGLWGLTAAAVALLVLTRPTGILVIPCLLFLCWRDRPNSRLAWVPVIAGPAALAGFCVYQAMAFGTPFASMRAAAVSPWLRGPHQLLLDITLHGRPGMPPGYFLFMIVVGAIVLAATPLIGRRLGAAYALFSALSVLAPAASGLVSLERYVAVDFPLFTSLALTHNKHLIFGLLLFQTYLMLFITAAFAAGWGVF